MEELGEKLTHGQLRETLYGFEMREEDLRRVEQRKSPDIKQMWQRSFEIIGMAASGMKNVEIAKLLNISPQTVSNTLNSELGMKRLSELRGERDARYDDVQERIREQTQLALDVYQRILEAEESDPVVNLKDKVGVANTVMLELSGHRAAQKVHQVNTQATLDEIAAFKERGKAAAAEAGLLVKLEESPDGTFKEVPITESDIKEHQ